MAKAKAKVAFAGRKEVPFSEALSWRRADHRDDGSTECDAGNRGLGRVRGRGGVRRGGHLEEAAEGTEFL